MFTGLPPLTLAHVIISLIAIASGFAVLIGLINTKMLDAWTATFLATTVLTSVTGFFLPAAHLMPSHVVGIISLVVLMAAIAARYLYHLPGASPRNLRCHGDDRVLPQRIRAGGAALRKSAVAQGTRADAIGA